MSAAKTVEDLFGIAGKVVLITGGARGMGRFIAETMVAAGAQVIISARKQAACDEAEAALSKLGSCRAIAADLSSAAGASELARKVAALTPKLDVLINNAGRTWGAKLEEFPDDQWSTVMTTNVQVPFTLVRDLLPLLRASASASDPARVINIGSMAGHVASRLNAYSYGASKAAIHHVTRMLASDLAAEHITVNTIAPGWFPTKMMGHISGNPEAEAGVLEQIPLGRFGTREDIGGMCVMLSSRAGAYITGALMALDGGMTGCR